MRIESEEMDKKMLNASDKIRKRILNSQGASLLGTVLIAGAAAFALMVTTTEFLPTLQKISRKNIENSAYQGLLNGTLSYVSNSIQQRWCLTESLLQDPFCIESGRTPKEVLEHPRNLELLLLSDDARKDILKKYPSQLKSIKSFSRAKPMQIKVDISKISQLGGDSHPISMLMTPSIMKCVESIDIKMYTENSSLRKPLGDEKYVWIYITLIKKELSLINFKGSLDLQECSDSQQAKGLYLFSPRVNNSFALVKTTSMDLEHDLAGAAEGRGVKFYGKVYVGGSGTDTGNIEIAHSKNIKQNITFFDTVSLEGSLLNNGQFYSEESNSGAVHTNYNSFNGFLGGISLEQVADKGIDHIFSSSSVNYDLMAFCAKRERLRNEFELTAQSRTFARSLKHFNDRGAFELALSGQNEFTELLNDDVYPPGDDSGTTQVEGGYNKIHSLSLSRYSSVDLTYSGDTYLKLDDHYPSNYSIENRFERKPVLDIYIQPRYKDKSKYKVGDSEFIKLRMSRSAEAEFKIFNETGKGIDKWMVHLNSLEKRYRIDSDPLDELFDLDSKKWGDVAYKASLYESAVDNLKYSCKYLPQLKYEKDNGGSLSSSNEQVLSVYCHDFYTESEHNLNPSYKEKDNAHNDSIEKSFCGDTFPQGAETQRLIDAKKDVSDYKATYETAEKRKAEIDLIIGGKEAIVKKQQDEVDAWKAKVNSKKIEINKVKANIDYHEFQINKKQGEINDILAGPDPSSPSNTAEINELQSQIIDHKSKITKLESDLSKLEDQLVGLESEFAKSEAELAAAQEDLQDTKDSFKSELNKIDKVFAEWEARNNELKNAQYEYDQLNSSSRSTCQNKLNDVKNNYQKVTSTNEELKAALQEYSDKIPTLILATSNLKGPIVGGTLDDLNLGSSNTDPLLRRSDRVIVSYRIKNIQNIKRFGELGDYDGFNIILNPYEFGYKNTSENLRYSLSASKALQPGPSEIGQSGHISWKNKKLNRMVLKIDSGSDDFKESDGQFSMNYFTSEAKVFSGEKGESSYDDGLSELPSSLWTGLKYSEYGSIDYQYTPSSVEGELFFKYDTETTFSYAAVCEKDVALSASDWDLDLSGSTAFSWIYQVEAMGVVIENPKPEPLAELIFDEAQNFSRTTPSVSIIDRCVVNSSTNFVFGFYVCKDLIIEERSSKNAPMVHMVGSFIVENLKIHPSANYSGVGFYSIWNDKGRAILEKYGKLKRVNSVAKDCSFAGEKAIWRGNVSHEMRDDLYACSPMKFVKEGPRNFSWSTIDPETGLISGQPETTSKIKGRYKRFTTHEVFRKLF